MMPPVMQTEQHVDIPAGETSLFGSLHLPRHDPAGGVVVCLPIFEERKAVERAVVEAARSFAARGLAVLRFDYRGCGDSPGDFDAFSTGDWVRDIRTAAAWLAAAAAATATTPVALLGIRLGGALALSAAAALPAVRTVALWDPALDGAACLDHELRRKLMKEMLTVGRSRNSRAALTGALRAGQSVDLDGYRLSARLYRDICALTPAGPRFATPPPRLFCARLGPRGAAASARDDPVARLAGRGCEVHVEHVDLPPFWSLVGYVDITPLTETTCSRLLAWNRT
jgi:exosortase A-associated hydrolase 2